MDGKSYPAELGAWAFYAPKLQLKVFHSVAGLVHCTHASAPEREQLLNFRTGLKNDKYTIDEWTEALSKSVIVRAAENYIAAKRLFVAGIGPDVSGFLIIHRFGAPYSKAGAINIGLFVDDLRQYPQKRETTREELPMAGVIPDKIESCIRQQINGYVSDLNSVVGVMPDSASDAVKSLSAQILAIAKTEYCCGSDSQKTTDTPFRRLLNKFRQ